MNTARPPIVTILGHVDHGKTTLLDKIRDSHVASREAGGITQGIGASKVDTNDGAITFVDTPGHATFSQMRARGAKVCDIAVLVVAADDGIMPQTKEALTYIHENKIPFIVALTKMDLPSVNTEKVVSQFTNEGVFLEGQGGQVPFVKVSAKDGRGIDELLELIHLMASINEIKADPHGKLAAVVIETNKDKRGPIVSVVVKNGTISVGDTVSAGSREAKVKGLFDYLNKPVKLARPGDPVVVLGFSDLPFAGETLTSGPAQALLESDDKATGLKVKDGEIALIVKAQTAGALEAIVSSLPKGAVVLSSSVGSVTESDIFFAKTSGAIVVAFDVKIPSGVKKLAEADMVEVEEFNIIYELFEFVRAKVEEQQIRILGRAEVLAEFPFNKDRVAGCKVLEGRIHKNDRLVLMRGQKALSEVKITSLRRGKAELVEAKAGEECGIILKPQLPFEKGDILVAIK